jgi:hypothetical protein
MARPSPAPVQPPRLVEPVRVVIDAGRVTGLSDLAVDSAGQLWAIAERTRVLVRMQADGSEPTAIPIDGVSDEVDVEGLAWLDGERVALATEADDPARTSDVILLGRLRGDRVAVEGNLRLDYGLWPLQPRGNQGIEGLCRSGRALVASVETVIEDGARRLAPVATYDLDRARWAPYLVRLATSTGKISGMSCRPRGGRIDVMAIERHFQVARLIRFEVPAPAPGQDAPVEIEPILVADLAPLLQRVENFEGVVWDGDREIALVVDNDWATVTGPNLLVRARLSGPAPSPPPVGEPPPASFRTRPTPALPPAPTEASPPAPPPRSR